jgi:chaperonin GroEL (HSP60 family)
MGAELVRQAARATRKLAGDGGTTTVLLARSIFDGSTQAVEAGTNCFDVKHGIAMAVRAVCGYDKT